MLLDNTKKWLVLFESKNIILLKTLVFSILSIFSSNSYCESVFSVVNNVWTEDKSRLNIDTLNALVSVKCNSNFKCSEMYSVFLKNCELLKKAQSVTKYNCIK